jgi:hypothetical protein
MRRLDGIIIGLMLFSAGLVTGAYLTGHWADERERAAALAEGETHCVWVPK